ncbi:flagellar biosynthetic protein FliR [Halioxenophilus aromaticivorans]|uniref:Flagellar biosynthetic protein FliR n=1 Tax=Halioxenophilus aromaticivorans TaxID=1306992 RepID=A0AAV3U0M2_9ALTE
MLELTEPQLSHMMGQYLWPLIRIAAFIMAVPIYGSQTLPARFRLAISAPLAVVIQPMLPPLPGIEMVSIAGFITTIKEVVIGAALGFIFQILMQLFVVGGQIIAMNMGLGFASMNDPANGIAVTVLSQFFVTIAVLLFLAMNGHLVLLELIARSFQVWPIGQAAVAGDFWRELAGLGSWMFAGALVMALPIVTAILVVNMAFGVMSRSAPQMNIFAVGFPVTLVFGMFIIWFGLTNFMPQFELRSNQIIQFVENLLGI